MEKPVRLMPVPVPVLALLLFGRLLSVDEGLARTVRWFLTEVSRER
jgi:hypothetical protein